MQPYLQIAFSSLIANRTIKWVINKKEFHDPFTGFFHKFSICFYIHAWTNCCKNCEIIYYCATRGSARLSSSLFFHFCVYRYVSTVAFLYYMCYMSSANLITIFHNFIMFTLGISIVDLLDS